MKKRIQKPTALSTMASVPDNDEAKVFLRKIRDFADWLVTIPAGKIMEYREERPLIETGCLDYPHHPSACRTFVIVVRD